MNADISNESRLNLKVIEEKKESDLSIVKNIMHDLFLNIYQHFVITKQLTSFIKNGPYLSLEPSFINKLFAERSRVDSKITREELKDEQKIIEMLMIQPLHKDLLTFLSDRKISANDFLFLFGKLRVYETDNYIFNENIINGKTDEFVEELNENKNIAFNYITRYQDFISFDLATRMFAFFD